MPASADADSGEGAGAATEGDEIVIPGCPGSNLIFLLLAAPTSSVIYRLAAFSKALSIFYFQLFIPWLVAQLNESFSTMLVMSLMANQGLGYIFL